MYGCVYVYAHVCMSVCSHAALCKAVHYVAFINQSAVERNESTDVLPGSVILDC